MTSSSSPDVCAVLEGIGAAIRAEFHAIAFKIADAFEHRLVKKVFLMDRDNGRCLLECTKAFVVYYEKYRDHNGQLQSKLAPFLVSSGILGAKWTESTNLALVIEWQANPENPLSRYRSAFEGEIVFPGALSNTKVDENPELDAWFTSQVTGGEWYHQSTGVCEDISPLVLMAAGPTHDFSHSPLLRAEDVLADRHMEPGDEVGIFDTFSGSSARRVKLGGLLKDL